MRFYSFCNYYISPIQHGIQTAHCAVDMRVKYPKTKVEFVSQQACDMYTEWAERHKTIIVLNGGNSNNLMELYMSFDSPANPYPFDFFREDEQSLNGALTCVGIILPEKIYEGAALLRDRRNGSKRVTDTEHWVLVDRDGDFLQPETIEYYTKFEVELMTKLNDYRLA